ncbi:MAG: hypothetical protein K6E54_07235 [Bacteroidaceae bacterium]|nr:hypothetical protein [Bacteroidaceae bacterium]
MDSGEELSVDLEEESVKREVEEVINKLDEDSVDDDVELSLRSLLGGDILASKFIRRQILFIIFVVGLMIFYTANRYASQDEQIEIDNLRKELQDVKYNVLTQSSELMNYTRQSNVEEILKKTPDSVLSSPETAPYLIRQDDEDDEGFWPW